MSDWPDKLRRGAEVVTGVAAAVAGVAVAAKAVLELVEKVREGRLAAEDGGQDGKVEDDAV